MKRRLPTSLFPRAAMLLVVTLALAEASVLPQASDDAQKEAVDLAEKVDGSLPLRSREVSDRAHALRRARRRAEQEQAALHARRFVDEQKGNKGPSLSDVDFEPEEEERYIGYCKNAYIRMWPGNSRKFWSYGYVYLKEPYLANCTMLYYYNTRKYPNDDFCKFGFRVRGSFEGHTDSYATCTDTDYVFLNDSNGHEAYFCGTNSVIDWTTIEDNFEFHFVTKADSPRAKGFFTIIESFKLCGGAYTIQNDGPTGTFTSPLFPNHYPGNVACNWYFAIPVEEGYEVSARVACKQFSLQEPFNNGTEYCLDALQFTYEAPYPTETQSYCSNVLAEEKHIVHSIHHSMLVSFRSDELIADSGFNCTYEYILFGE